MPNQGEKDKTPHLYKNDSDITDEKEVRMTKEEQTFDAPGSRHEQALPASESGTEKIDSGDDKVVKTLESDLKSASEKCPINSETRCKQFLDSLLSLEMTWHYGYTLVQTIFSNYVIENLEEKLSKLTEGISYRFPRDLSDEDSFAFEDSDEDSFEFPDPDEITLESQTPDPQAEIVREYLEKRAAVYKEYFASLDFSKFEDLVTIACCATLKSVCVSCETVWGPGSGSLFLGEDLYFDTSGKYMLNDVPLQDIIKLVDKARESAKSQGWTSLVKYFDIYSSWMTVLEQRIPQNPANLKRLIQLVEEYKFSEVNPDEVNVHCYIGSGCESRTYDSYIRQPPQILSPDKSKELLLKILNAMQKFTPVFNLTRSVELTGFYLQFSTREEPAIVRAMACDLINKSTIFSKNIEQWCYNDICEVLPLPKNSKEATTVPEKAKDGTESPESEFLTQASRCYTNLLTIFCRNRSRAREGLCTLVLKLDNLQVSAQRTDQIMAETPSLLNFTNWCYMRKLQVMIWIILLSFEEDIVPYSEAGYVSWYANVLCQELLAHLGRMRGNFANAGANACESSGYYYLVALEMEMQMLAQLSSSKFMLYVALHKLNPPAEVMNTTPEMQYQLRFEMFESITIPQTPDYSAYIEMFEALDIETALRGSANSATSVKNLLTGLGDMAEANDDIPKLKRSSIGLCIAVSMLVKMDENAKFKVEVDREGFHPYFPVPKIVIE